MSASVFSTLKRGCAAIAKGAQDAYDSWSDNEVDDCLEELTASENDLATLLTQVQRAKQELLASKTHVGVPP